MTAMSRWFETTAHELCLAFCAGLYILVESISSLTFLAPYPTPIHTHPMHTHVHTAYLLMTAAPSGVVPYFEGASMAAPHASSRRTIDACPCAAALNSAVSPSSPTVTRCEMK